LAEATVVRYVKLARSALRRQERDDVGPAAARDRGRPGREHSPRSVGSTNGRVAELQALLKFLYVAGLAPQPLVTLVPPVAGWHDTGVPKANPAADVQRLLDSCDRTNPIGVSGRRRGPAVPRSPAR
jgi:integrase